MSTISQKYADKTRIVLQIIGDLGSTWQSILERYEGHFFSNGFPKDELIAAAIVGDSSNKMLQKLDFQLNHDFSHFKGNRTGLEYGLDLILGWIIEDAFDEALTRMKLEHRLDGADATRDFLSIDSISASADFRIGAQNRKLELASDYSGFWQRSDKYDLRDFKYRKLASERSILFLIDGFNRRGGVIDLGKPEIVDIEHVPFHAIYRKPVTSILKINSFFTDIPSALENLRLSIK